MNRTLTLTGFFLFILIITSCNGSKPKSYYSGSVVDESGMPIAGVLIREGFPDGNNDTTDNAGCFNFKRSDSGLHSLIFSKKGYRTDTVEMVWLMHGEKEVYSGFVTNDSAKWVMREIHCRDSVLNWSDKLRFFDNDSIQMHRDARIMYTQYLNRPKGEIIYRYYDYSGTVQREVYNTDLKIGQIHFRYYRTYGSGDTESIAYISTYDSIPNPLNEDLSSHRYVSVLKKMRENQLLSETYLSWQSLEDYIAGDNDYYIAGKEYDNKNNSLTITKYTENGTISWDYYPNGQLRSHWSNQGLYGGIFSTFLIQYDSLGHKTEEITWEHSYPKWGESYNDTFSVGTTREYYSNGKLKSLTKTKSFCESDSYRCGTWVYYNEQGEILKTQKYGKCYNFKLEDKYAESNFTKDN